MKSDPAPQNKSKKIKAVLLFFASVALGWASYSFERFIPWAATIGGLMVVAGLKLEDCIEVEWFKSVEHERESKKREHFGRSLVAWGVWFEVVIGASIAAHDVGSSKNIEAHISTLETNVVTADPRNLPINSISGYAIVEVRATKDFEKKLAQSLHQILADKSGIHFDLNASDRMRQNPESVELFFGEFPNESPSNPPNSIFTIGWIDSINTVVDDSKPYVPNLFFVLSFDSGNFWNPDALTFNKLKFVQIGGLGRNGEIEPPMEVIGGRIVLKANRDWSKEFSFPKQRNQFFRVSSFETNGTDVPAGYGNLTNEPAAK